MKLSLPTLGDRRRLKALVTSTTGIVTAMLIGAKLGGVITFPWWLVLGPLWMPFVLVLALILLSSLGDFLVEMLELRSEDSSEYDDGDDWGSRS